MDLFHAKRSKRSVKSPAKNDKNYRAASAENVRKPVGPCNHPGTAKKSPIKANAQTKKGITR